MDGRCLCLLHSPHDKAVGHGRLRQTAHPSNTMPVSYCFISSIPRISLCNAVFYGANRYEPRIYSDCRNSPRALRIPWCHKYLSIMSSRLTIANTSTVSLPSPHCVGCSPAVDHTASSTVISEDKGSYHAAIRPPLPGPRARYPPVWCAWFGGGKSYYDYRALYDEFQAPRLSTEPWKLLPSNKSIWLFDHRPTCTVPQPACTSDVAGHRTTTPVVVA